MHNALVPLFPLAPADETGGALRRSGRPRADFIAHLIATAGKAPQTRMRRRAGPGEASMRYRALDSQPLPGRAISRSF